MLNVVSKTLNLMMRIVETQRKNSCALRARDRIINIPEAAPTLNRFEVSLPVFKFSSRQVNIKKQTLEKARDDPAHKNHVSSFHLLALLTPLILLNFSSEQLQSLLQTHKYHYKRENFCKKNLCT